MVFLWMLGSVMNRSSALPLYTAASEIVISTSLALETKRCRSTLDLTNVIQMHTCVNCRRHISQKATQFSLNTLPPKGQVPKKVFTNCQ